MEEGHFLIFEVDLFHFCAPVDTVLGIIMPPHVTKMPLAPFHVAGSFLFRDNVALALDMRRQLGLPEFVDGSGIFIVAQLESGIVGFRADAVADIVPASRLEAYPVPLANLYHFFKQFVLFGEQILLQTDFEMLFAAEVCAGPFSGLLESMAPARGQQPGDTAEEKEGGVEGEGGDEAGDQPVTEAAMAEPEGQSGPQFEVESVPSSESAASPSPRLESKVEELSTPLPRRCRKPGPQPRSQSLVPPLPTSPGRSRQRAWTAPAKQPSRQAAARSVSWAPSLSGRELPDAPSRSLRGGPILLAVIILLLCLAAIFWWSAGEEPVSKKAGLEKVVQESAKPSLARQEYRLPGMTKRPGPNKPQATAAQKDSQTVSVASPQPVVVLPLHAGLERPAEVARIETNEFILTIERPTSQEQQQEATASPPVVAEKTKLTSGMITHIVVKNDTLWDIAEKYLGDPGEYVELARLSRVKDPHWIYPGDIIRIVKRSNGE